MLNKIFQWLRIKKFLYRTNKELKPYGANIIVYLKEPALIIFQINDGKEFTHIGINLDIKPLKKICLKQWTDNIRRQVIMNKLVKSKTLEETKFLDNELQRKN